MQWTNTGAVKGALHFHRPIFTFESGGADRSLFFCQASSSSPVLNAGLIWAGIIFAGVASGRQRFSSLPSESWWNLAVRFTDRIHISFRQSAVAGTTDLQAARQFLLPLYMVKDFTFRLPVGNE